MGTSRNHKSRRPRDVKSITAAYFNLVYKSRIGNIELEQQELIWANGALTESYFSSYRSNGYSLQIFQQITADISCIQANQSLATGSSTSAQPP